MKEKSCEVVRGGYDANMWDQKKEPGIFFTLMDKVEAGCPRCQIWVFLVMLDHMEELLLKKFF